MVAQKFWTEDICALKKNSNQIGVIERTHYDVDTHEIKPESSYPSGIKRNTSVKRVDFESFLRSGIPPPGQCLVLWNDDQQAELIREERLKLLDRSLLFGDVVKKDPQSAMAGQVISTSMTVDIAPYGNGGDRLLGAKPYIRDVPVEELTSAHDYMEGDVIIYQEWVGKVEEAIDEVALRLANGSVVIPDATEEVEKIISPADRLSVGDLAQTKKGNLRRGLWKYGAYNPNVQPSGTVVEVRTVGLSVHWLCCRLDKGMTFPQPHDFLDVDVLESSDIYVYDRTRRPPHDDGNFSPKIQGANIATGETVRFKDLTAACLKYQSKPGASAGDVKIPRTRTYGYDMNVFKVFNSHTEGTVRWQDTTVSTHRSTSLIPHTDLDDGNNALPGEVVCGTTSESAQTSAGDDSWLRHHEKVGVVQKVSANDRTAQVRWMSEASVTFAYFADDPNSQLLPDSKTGTAEGPVEEVSLYEVLIPTALNQRLGDLVLLQRPNETVTTSASEEPDDHGWLGEVVDQGLDGLLTVRLGASKAVKDVRVKIEDVVLAYSGDMGDYGDEIGDSENDFRLSNDEDEEDMEADSEEENEAYDDDEMTDDYETFPEVGSIRAGFTYRMRPENLAQLMDIVHQYSNHDGDSTMSRADTADIQMADAIDEGDEDWTTDESDDDDSDMDSDKDSGTGGNEKNASSANDDTPLTDLEPNETPEARGPSREGTSSSSSRHPPFIPASHSLPPPSPALDLLSFPNAPPSFSILSAPVPSTHHYSASPAPDPSNIPPSHIRRITKEHSILSTSLPSGIYVRTWESRLDLLRILIVGPLDTPYELAPFLIDCRLGPNFPSRPPDLFFHSWPTGVAYMGGGATNSGPGDAVNPNLYENGKICLSLLGTWHADHGGEAWSPGKSTVLQVLVSLLGLVLVREPYYNEAGYETRISDPASALPSALYTERAYFRTRAFIAHALTHPSSIDGLADVVDWLYRARGGEAEGAAPRLLDRAIALARETVERSGASGDGAGEALLPRDGLRRCSVGAVVLLKRAVARLEALRGEGGDVMVATGI
ncbi:MAG: hypothetical protein M1821_003348 [Bathelium mastoideum]|nr:MAG: hypothetical protein M1821_003348 [Bathelium mastoideum]